MTEWVSGQKEQNHSIGFVPTMGALHQGHLSLVAQSVAENDATACSIFVNPIQFNNQEDLEKYPRTLEQDLQLLEEAGCNVVFAPSVEEMYPEEVQDKYDFGHLEKVMEGRFRPGHFNGVVIVVKKLFLIVKPDRAYFGKKDYQQLAIIRAMTEVERLPVEIVPCPIVREQDGLAMSSRNMRLSTEERALAPEIYRILSEAASLAAEKDIAETEAWVHQEMTKKETFRLEYFEIVDGKTLLPAKSWNSQGGVIGCIALWLGNIRLIDNIEFKK